MRSLLVLFATAAVLTAQPNPFRFPANLGPAGPAVLGQPETSADVAVNRSGDLAVVWKERTSGPSPSDYNLRLRRGRGGFLAGPPLTVATSRDLITGAGELLVVRCAIDEEGNIAVVWDDTDPVSGWLRVRLAVLPVGATAALGPIDISPAGLSTHHVLPDVVIGRDPGAPRPVATVVWQQSVLGGQQEIQSRRVRVDPTTLVPSPAVRVDSDVLGPNDGQDRPTIARDEAGRVAILWQRFEAYSPGFSYWRMMFKAFDTFGNVIPVADATARHASGGFDFSDYELGPDGDPAMATDPASPPQLTGTADGRMVAAWRRFGGFPFGIRGIRFQGGSYRPEGYVVWNPLAPASFPTRFDFALGPGGVPHLLFDSRPSVSGGSSSVYLASIDLSTGLTFQQTQLAPTAQLGITAVALALSDSGSGLGTVCRGFGLANQSLQARPVATDPMLLEPNTPVAGEDRLRIAVPDAAGQLYVVWPLVAPAPTRFLPLPDGRTADVNLADPLLTWHLSLTAPNPVFLDAEGLLDANGEGAARLRLPASVRPISFAPFLMVFDPTRPLPQALRLFTQPATLSFP